MPDTNRLAGETSPYLRQHATHPVHWLPWGETALERSRVENRPILLSIGYSACHWCHVMAHESFEDAAVAAVMNRLFVNVKVDREERPDLDQIYQTAHQMLTGRSGGWPLTVFLAPDGAPFFTGTYFPREPRYGLPGFADLCERIGELWRTRRDDIDRQNRDLVVALGRAPAGDTGQPDAAAVHALRELLLASHDREFGGFGGAPKFPHPTDLAFLMHRPDDAPARQAALFTLRCMAQGGLHDQLGGGFCRYSVDERWEIPHFEKMLYDNGPLLGLYAEAWALSGDNYFRQVAEGIVGWLQREMTSPEGAFYSALDADSEGEEGRFYLWDRDAVNAALPPEETAVACRCWGLDDPPNFEHRNWHLKLTTPPAAEEQALLDAAREQLLAVRDRRIRPGCDDKILTSWNALMIAGLLRAARIFGREDWRALGCHALDFLKSRRWHDGKLWATDRLPGYLDDYAFLIAALIESLQAGYRATDLVLAVELADAMIDAFEDKPTGGFFFTAHNHEKLIQRPKSGHDNATPAGNGVAAFALQRLGHLLGEMRYLDAAQRTLTAFGSQMGQRPGGFATLVTALEEHLQPPVVVLLRGPATELVSWQTRLAAQPHTLTIGMPNGLGDFPAALARPETERVNAWVCCGVNCLAPIEDFALLESIFKAGEFR